MNYRFLILFLFVCFFNSLAAQLEWALEPVVEYEKFYYRPDINDKYIKVVVEPRKKEGVIDKNGKLIFDPNKFQSIQMIRGNELISAMTPDKEFFLMNKAGKIIGKKFDETNSYHPTNLVWVKKDDKWGMMDTSGVTIIKPKYKRLQKIKQGHFVGTLPDKSKEPFFLKETTGRNSYQEATHYKIQSSQIKDRVMVNVKSKKRNFDYWGFNSLQGDTILRPNRYYSSYNKMRYEEQVMVAIDSENMKEGVIDKFGKILIPFEYEKIDYRVFNNHFVVKQDGKYGVLNWAGENIIPFEYDLISVLEKEGVLITTKAKKMNMLDSNLVKLLKEDYDRIDRIPGQVLKLKKGKLFGFYSLKTKKLTSPRFIKFSRFPIAVCGATLDKKFALFDSHAGKQVTDAIYTKLKRAGNYYLGDYSYQDSIKQDTAYRYITKTEKHLLDFSGKILRISKFPGMALLKDDIFITRNPKGDTVQVFNVLTSEERVLVGKNIRVIKDGHSMGDYHVIQIDKDQFCFIDEVMKGNPPVYEYLGKPKDGLRLYKKNEKFGFTHQGQPVTPPIYEAIGNINKAYVDAKFNGKWGVLKNPYFEKK